MTANYPPLRTALVWFAVLIVLALLGLGVRPYFPIDETRYVSVAWEMWLRGDFLVPFKNGEPYSHKPPLLFWVFQAGWWAFGVNDWWPRMVSPLFSFASLMLFWRLARRMWPDDVPIAHAASMILFSSLLWQFYSQAVMFDVMLTAFTLAAIWALVEIGLGGGWRWWALFIVSIGLGVLTKGPFIILYVAPVGYLLPWILPQSGLNWWSWLLRITLAFAAGGSIGLAWAIPAGFAGGEEYRQAIFWKQTAHRVTESFAHKRPFFWYLPLLPILMFPWLAWPSLVTSAYSAVRHSMNAPGTRLALVWFVTAFVALSAASGKQAHYLLPGFPGLALLLALGVGKVQNPRLISLGVLLILFGVALMLAPSLVQLGGKMDVLRELPRWAGMGLVLAGLVALLFKFKNPTHALTTLAYGVFVWILFVILPPMSKPYDVTAIAQKLAAYQAAGRPIAHEGFYNDQYQFFGRLEAPLLEIDSSAIQAWLEANPNGVAVVYRKGNAPRDLAGLDVLFAYPYLDKQALLVRLSGGR